MLPPLRQRLLVTAAVIVGGLVWMQVEPSLLPADRTGGVTLVDAAVGPIVGAVLVVLGGLIAIALAILTGSLGSPLAAAFVLAGSLFFLAADGGSGLAFLWHTEPSDYLPLLMETAAWFALLAATLWLTATLRPAVRRRLPWLITDDRPRPRQSPLRGFTDPSSLLAAVVCTAVAGFLSHLMLRSWDIGQVLGTLVFAFALGGLIAQVVTPTASVGPMLFSPLILAAYGYIQAWASYGQTDELLSAAYREHLVGFAWTLPIHFASAGVVGCVLGAGMAHGLMRAERSTQGQQLARQIGGGPGAAFYHFAKSQGAKVRDEDAEQPEEPRRREETRRARSD